MIVVDCSVLVDALVSLDAEPLGERLAEERLAAPALVDVEFVSAVRGLALGRHVSEHRAMDLLDDFDQLLIDRWDFSDEFRKRAFALRHSATTYDSAYVALAEVLDCPLLTRDRRLAKAAKKVVEVIVV